MVIKVEENLGLPKFSLSDVAIKRSGQAVAVVKANIHLNITTLYYRYIIKDRVCFPGFS
jgi:hypothetical protein